MEQASLWLASYEKLFVVGTPEDSTNPQCAPSYGLQMGADITLTAATTDVLEAILALVLAQGMILTIPDHEGPDSAFAAGRLAGHAMLDVLLSVLIGLTRAYPDFKESFESIATPKMEALVKDNVNAVLCNINRKALFVDFLTSTEYLTLGLASLKLPVWAATLQDNKLGANATLTPTMPVQITHAKGDDLIPYEQAAQMVAAYCATGTAPVQFHTDNNPLANHITEAVFGLPGAFAWLNDRLDGVPVAKGCVYTS
ncbi:hypothetical protein RQP46_000787 [Phenoliferia psychrophenolica]